MKVQEEMVRRTNISEKDGKRRVYSGKLALSSIVFCGECGEIYRRVHWNNRGCKSIVWRCVSRLEGNDPGCLSPTVYEETLLEAINQAINETLGNKAEFLEKMKYNVWTVLNEDQDESIKELEKKLKTLQLKLVGLSDQEADFNRVKDEILQLREQKVQIQLKNVDREEKRQRIEDMTVFLSKQSATIEAYDDQLVRRLIEKVTVFKEKLAIEFKSGLLIEVDY